MLHMYEPAPSMLPAMNENVQLVKKPLRRPDSQIVQYRVGIDIDGCKRKPSTADYIRASSGEQLASEENRRAPYRSFITAFVHRTSHHLPSVADEFKTSCAAMRN